MEFLRDFFILTHSFSSANSLLECNASLFHIKTALINER